MLAENGPASRRSRNANITLTPRYDAARDDHTTGYTDDGHTSQQAMCPLRYIILLLSAIVAIFGVVQTFRAEDDEASMVDGKQGDGATARRRSPLGTLWSYCNGGFLLQQWRERNSRRTKAA